MEAKQKVAWFAVVSRISVLVLQCLFNAFCPDHEADAFVSPLDPRTPISIFDTLVSFLFGGLTRWDAQYFLHISKFGFTYENTLAFYPLYPMLIRFVSLVMKNFLFFMNVDSVTTLSGVVINFYCFVKASLVLYDLTLLITKNPKVAYTSAILFCINPASIFFSALYTESLFAYLTFYSMLVSFEKNSYLFLPLSLSMITRSNGMTNLGYPLFIWLRSFLSVNLIDFLSSKKCLCYSLRNVFAGLVQVSMTVFLSLVPVALLQVYNYTKFCTSQLNETTLPLHVVHHAIEKKLVLAGSENHPHWCHDVIPLSYSYVQNKYWKVGFFTYYQAKQIPNFLLALPVLFIMTKCIFDFFREHRNKQLLSLLLENKENIKAKYPMEMFAFVVHGMFLTLFIVLFVHIQVGTRMIFSASPLPYWFCALAMNETEKKKNSGMEYEDMENLDCKWRVFFMTRKKLSIVDRLVLVYFLGYFIVGCFMYSNFLPWT